MGFREVTMLEIKELLRRHLAGEPKKRIAPIRGVKRHLFQFAAPTPRQGPTQQLTHASTPSRTGVGRATQFGKQAHVRSSRDAYMGWPCVEASDLEPVHR